jgi:hypothetical protein
MNALHKQSKRIRLQQLIYPGVLLIFAIILLSLFAKASMFLSKHVNKPFAIAELNIESALLRINLEQYDLITKKLGIVTTNTDGASEAAEKLEQTEEISELESILKSSTQKKQALKIAVFNTTNITGKAASLKADLGSADFNTVTIGSQSPVREQTSIQIKESLIRKAEILELRQVVGQQYSLEENDITILDEQNGFDVIIIIGQE